MQLDKISTYLGFAIRSKKAVFGLEMLLRLKTMPQVILYDENIGNSALKQIKFFNEVKNIKTVMLPASFLDNTTNKKNVKILSILDEHLGNAIINSIN